MKKILLITVMILLCGSYAFAWDYAYDLDSPAGSVNANTLDTAIQNHKKGNQERLDIDHQWPDTNAGLNDLTCGCHRKVTMLELSTPTTVSGGGIVYVGTDNELHYNGDDSGDVQITDGGELVLDDSLSLQDLSVTRNAAVSGLFTAEANAVIDGTLSVGDDVTVNGHLFASDQLGAWTAKSDDTAYLAATDGFVTSYISNNSNTVQLLSDGSNPPTTQRATNQGPASGDASVCILVKKGDYYKSSSAGAATVYWLPLD